MNKRQKIRLEMAEDLKNNYDYIGKMDALHFLKPRYNHVNGWIGLALRAHTIAYEN